jgi:multiple sugar transport system ATP-binding protein
VLRRGEVQQVGSPKELSNAPANLFVAGFIGSPAMNLLPAELDGDRLRLPMVEMTVPDEVRGRLAERGGAQLIAGVRPEHFEDAALVGDKAGDGVTFTADIEVIEWMGAELYAHFGVSGSESVAEHLADLAEDLETVGMGSDGATEVVARLDAASGAKEGASLELWLDTRRIFLFDPATGENLTRPAGSAHPDHQPA